jgi:hypothetical protein
MYYKPYTDQLHLNFALKLFSSTLTWYDQTTYKSIVSDLKLKLIANYQLSSRYMNQYVSKNFDKKNAMQCSFLTF